MKNFLKYLVSALGGAALTFGATDLTTTTTSTQLSAQVATATAQKDSILEDYVNDQVRLNEVPTLDLSIATPDEMTAAIGTLANTEGVVVAPDGNVFTALHDAAVQNGTACK